ncbi:VOC family protein [Sulfurirhabdus autotrophica]|uniref:Catechol 2,3-dioxygenase-like lactoylglutathione lyase family enzyme n=1 Tax=Sulfurirhabdus autotrophica TaxID=1706046 RepID=A0A4R3YCG9_9PROT|nr:VOC family protein [Sulfurirhabdus autotrophica]TCV90145.1 catechol 2,3-dioxygenase-like lactoylglutathione lyase family enzyme [Sulfurirhabdus autotrophica]
MSNIAKFLHSSLLVSDLNKAKGFYEDVLGLVPSQLRPEMRFDGVWYEIGAQQIHLLVLPNPDKDAVRPEHGGNDRHIALGVMDIAVLQKMLEEASIPFTLSKSGRSALFCRDPDGNALEFVEV